MPRAVTEHAARKVMLDAGFEPSTPYPGGTKPWPGVCLKCGQPGTPRYIEVRSHNASPCQYCSGSKVDEAVRIGRFMALDFSPSTPYPGNGTPWPGVCLKCGQPGKPRHSKVFKYETVNGQRRLTVVVRPCRHCSQIDTDDAVAVGMMMARDFLPSIPYPGSKKPWPGVCLKCGQPGSPNLKEVRHAGYSPCAYCRRVGSKKLDSAIVIGKFLAVGLEPLEAYPGSAAKWKCRCLNCGKHTYPRAANVIHKNSGCKHCRSVLFSETQPHQVRVRERAEKRTREALNELKMAGFTPIGKYRGVKSPVLCLCGHCGREHSVRLEGLRSGNHACPRRKGERISEGKVAKSLKRVKAFAEANGYQFLDHELREEGGEGRGGNRLWLRVKCEEEHSYWIRSNHFQRGVGCAYCQELFGVGFHYDKPAHLYAVRGEDFLKVGISNDSNLENRLTEHKSNGLGTVLKLHRFEIGRDAFNAERKWLEFLEEIDQALRPTKTEFGVGYTEAVRVHQEALDWVMEYFEEIQGAEYLKAS